MADIFRTIAYSISTIFLAIAIIVYPDQSFDASIRGITLWLEVVFPSLLPFFIVAELLLAFGIVRLIGMILEPLMRPLFNIPGSGGVVIGMGLASGYPSGAKITSRLRQEGVLTQTEAERLVSFTNASNPLFIFGAIAVGFFHDPKTGLLLACSHYIGAVLVGLCMRFYRYNDDHKMKNNEKVHSDSFFKRAWRTLHEERIKENQPLGQVLGQAVTSSIKTLCVIGGFIVLFSVINKLLFETGATNKIGYILGQLFDLFSIPESLSLPFIAGLFEITLGAQMISNTENLTLLIQLVFVSAIMAFNGFSIQAQVASILAPTDIRFAPYFFARILHIFFSIWLTIILFKPLYLNRSAYAPQDIAVDSEAGSIPSYFWMDVWNWLEQYGQWISLSALLVGCIILFSQLKRAY
ncbi:sporulation integral membrane protein YlbJ [Tenuibacillus multivorans]|uniref:Sporulation integral membrane protein YlbJ n=1 Tax=Tenuibacillus multivorans TaxID=237069 RepID=A0A1G9Y815_9BACI|nr:sporulation integral membrane protein YlbJ [Tenuibacillus multivorans]GEL75987.1 sporulation integral membrane protein YlbJ [Tenuibacillus multivorans]SDN05292.1 sporulation integral membrane protein YlbJ [Tenuibacillus multivorans]